MHQVPAPGVHQVAAPQVLQVVAPQGMLGSLGNLLMTLQREWSVDKISNGQAGTAAFLVWLEMLGSLVNLLMTLQGFDFQCLGQYSSFSCSATTNLMWAKNTAMKPIPDEYETFYRINTCGPSVISLAQLGAEDAPSRGAERCFSALNETVRRRGLVHLRRHNLEHLRRRNLVHPRRRDLARKLIYGAFEAWAWFIPYDRPVYDLRPVYELWVVH
ncbi:uncharacterized protein C8Q71DRAFT_728328 [Rhodofomes roseus]|uniref:Uncharacterized protein n=1 Tax=Rhodofomes roseus TaxID=34475 RepID=A0ABQ8JZ51_9APHY|nr:uncharacterized protein C8Q71DRAFT_728328 [Rhodofomes roseus]KAH9829005.1 hypothetical protein C8Q71DRAFT_728328 [Rhodofomes roseus]